MAELTPRMLQVVDEILKGKSNREIAQALGMATRTAKAHAREIYSRYGIPRQDNVLRRIRLAVIVSYERNPELIPFLDGDRAQRLGFLSANDYIAQSKTTDSYWAPIP